MKNTYKMNKEILLVWQGTNEQSSGTITETDDMIVVYLDNRSKWEQMAVDKLLELSNKNPITAKLILKQTYENSYQGFFPLKQNTNGITNTTNTGFSNNATVSNCKVSGRSIVADRISQHLARNSESGNHTIDIEANIVR